MARAAYNVLVLPYYLKGEEIVYCIFKRSDYKIWQFISGGGEANEIPIEAAVRETYEESGIKGQVFPLRTMTYTPTDFLPDIHRQLADFDIFVMPLYCFAVEVESMDIRLSDEHLEYRWLPYKEARDYFHYDVDRTAIWELNSLLTKNT